MKNLIEKYNLLTDELKASIWYTISNIFQKVAPWLVMIILTHTLSLEEYGVYSVYMSWLEIIEIIVTLRIYSNGFVAGLVKNSDNKNEYSTTIEKISIILITIWMIVFIIFKGAVSSWISIDQKLIILMIFSFYGTVSYGIWSSRQRVDNKYKKILLATVVYSILGPVIGALTVFLNLNNKILYVVGIRTIIQFCVAIPFLYSNIRNNLKVFKLSFAISAIKFNLPLIPYYLSMVILNSSDKLMIQKIYNYSEAAIYSVAYSISMMIFIISGALNLAIQPWLFKKLKIKENNKDTSFINIGTIIVALFCLILVICGPELIKIFGGESYISAIWVMPPLILSVFVMFVYQQFVNVLFYYKQTHKILIVSVISAILNIVLNRLFIPKIGFIVAGYTTLFSYLCIMILYYIMMKKVCLKNDIEWKKIIDIKFQFIILMIMVILFLIIMLFYNSIYIRYIFIISIILIVIIKNKKIIKVLEGIKK